MGLKDLLVGMVPSIANQTKQSATGVSNHLKHNAKTQAINTRGTPDETQLSSLFFNPAKTQDAEKFDILQAFLVRGRAVLHITSNVHLAQWLGLQHIPKLQLNVPLLAQPTMTLINASLTKSMLKVKSEIGSVRLLIKDVLVNGFKVDRFTEHLVTQAKGIFTKAESIIHLEAPAIFQTGSVVGTNALTKIDVADIHMVAGKEEIHRLANLYSIESDMLLALIKTAVAIKSGTIQIDSLGDISLNATGTLNLKGNAVKITSLTTIDLGANAAITAQTQALTLHGVASASMLSTGVAAVTGSVGCIPFGMVPVPPIRPDLLVTLPSIPPILEGLLSGDTSVREADIVEQTEGMTAMGGSVI